MKHLIILSFLLMLWTPSACGTEVSVIKADHLRHAFSNLLANTLGADEGVLVDNAIGSIHFNHFAYVAGSFPRHLIAGEVDRILAVLRAFDTSYRFPDFFF